jgi:hypothetical protein
MTDPKIITSEMRAGIWQAELTGTAPDQVTVSHAGTKLEGVSVEGDPSRGCWRITVPIPAAAMSDGVQTFVVQDGQGATFADFAIAAGDVLADDLRAEVALLRAELDMLKSAFRKHSSES